MTEWCAGITSTVARKMLKSGRFRRPSVLFLVDAIGGKGSALIDDVGSVAREFCL